MGKPITESKTLDVPRSAYNLRFLADFAEHAHTQTYAKPWDEVMTYTLREPAGVAACNVAVEFPAHARYLEDRPGPGEAGQRFTEHPGVDLITFTEASATGSAVMAQAAPTLKRCSFELGGKSPAIVMVDADLHRAIPGTIDGMFRNQGEVCLAGSRLLVQRGIYAETVEKVVTASRARHRR
jgi:aminomuconate-semialdehyde/2-hydroxymuconate-6-semialdehyde dehydrogenase